LISIRCGSLRFRFSVGHEKQSRRYHTSFNVQSCAHLVRQKYFSIVDRRPESNRPGAGRGEQDKAGVPRRRGKIINIASVQSELARPGIAPYTATKGAVKNLTRCMCADWAQYGLQINAIAPGYFNTPLNQALVDNPEFSCGLEKRTPAARWGNVAELVGAAVFLSGRASSFVNGHTLCVDGGITTCL